MASSPPVLNGKISWMAEDGKLGIITRTDDVPKGQPADFFFETSNVLIGSPESGKLAQFSPDFTDEQRPLAHYVIVLDDAAKGARINAEFEQN